MTTTFRRLMIASALAALTINHGAAFASIVAEVEPNDSVVAPQAIANGSFSLDHSADIGDETSNTSTIIPHVTIQGTGNGTYDYYSFTIGSPGDSVILDIDNATLDTILHVYDSSGNDLAQDDDSAISFGQGGTSARTQSYLAYTFADAGTYVVRVSEFSFDEPNDAPISAGKAYNLHLSRGATPLCGNSVLNAGEQCDDGNIAFRDCCSRSCRFEPEIPVCPSVADIEPNDSVAGAQAIAGASFSLQPSPDIGDMSGNTSTTISHVSIGGTGTNTYDYYAIVVPSAGLTGVFDLDYSHSANFYLRLFNSGGTVLASNDDSSSSNGQAGSDSNLDPYIEYEFAAAGTYVIEVGRAGGVPLPNNLPDDWTYVLQISLGTPNECGDGSIGGLEQCDEGGQNGASTSCCTAGCLYRASGQECRASIADGCDLAESCTGSSAACPGDDFVGAADGASVDPETGNCFLSFEEPSTWNNAQAHCASLNGYLAVIESASENTAARGAADLAQDTWLGITDSLLEAGQHKRAFLTANGGTVEYEEFAAGEPNNAGGQEDCVLWRAGGLGWNDDSCADQFYYLCEIELLPCGDGVRQPGEACDLGRANGDASSCCTLDCEIETAGTTCRAAGFCQTQASECNGSFSFCPGVSTFLAGADRAVSDARTGHCYLGFDEASSWPDAQAQCESLGGNLAAIEDGLENVIAGSIGAFPGAASWIGIHDRDAEAFSDPLSFRLVTTDAPLIYHAFGNNEPNGGNTEDCAHFFANLLAWNDSNCTDNRPVLCELDTAPPTTTTTIATTTTTIATTTTTASTTTTIVTTTTTITTTTTLPPVLECPDEPADCKDDTPGKGTLVLKRKEGLPAKSVLSWKWGKGQATAPAAFGTPTTDAESDFRLCLYDGNSDRPIDVLLPGGATCGGAPCWRAIGSGEKAGFAYADKEGGNGGITSVTLKAGPDGKSSIKIKGKGANLTMPALPLVQAPDPVIIQLFSGSSGQCWGSSFGAPPLSAGSTTIFKDKSD